MSKPIKSYLRIKSGDVFTRWTVTTEAYSRPRACNGYREWFVMCRCSCGQEREVRVAQLFNGHSKSCGCLNRDILTSHAVHGESGAKKRTRLYRVWYAMIQRCTNPKHDSYPDYGGRGIAVCNEWRTSFVAFRDWSMAHGYSPDLEIDRANNDDGYHPGNCRWVTTAENKRNTRHTVMMTAFSETKCLTDWASDPRCSVSAHAIKHRIIRQGWSVEQAIATPPLTRKNLRRV